MWVVPSKFSKDVLFPASQILRPVITRCLFSNIRSLPTPESSVPLLTAAALYFLLVFQEVLREQVISLLTSHWERVKELQVSLVLFFALSESSCNVPCSECLSVSRGCCLTGIECLYKTDGSALGSSGGEAEETEDRDDGEGDLHDCC